MARKRDMSAENGKTAAKVHSTPIPEEPAPVHEEPAPTPIVELMKEPTPPLHEEQKRELFEWMLEEKRKIKPKDRLEKKRIDEEKSILKQFIRSKSIPDLWFHGLVCFFIDKLYTRLTDFDGGSMLGILALVTHYLFSWN